MPEPMNIQNELRQRLAQQAAISRLGRLALAGGDLDELMRIAVAELADKLRVEFTKLLELLPDGTSFLLKHGVGWKDGLVGHATVPAGPNSQAGYTLLWDSPVVVEDLARETRFNGPALLIEHGVISGLSVIIQTTAGPFGVLGAHTNRHRRFSESDIDFVQSVANILGDAITRERLLDDLRFQARILDQIHDAVVSTDLEARVTNWNRGAESLFGYTRQEALGRHISFVYPPEEHAYLEHKIIEPLLAKGEHNIEVRMVRKTGRPFYAHLSLSILKDKQGQPSGMIGYSIDITTRKLAATQIHELGRSVGSLSSAIQALRKGAWENSDLRGVLLTGMEQEASRLGLLLQDLSILDQRASGTLRITPQTIKLEDWLPPILAPWKVMAEQKGLEWDVDSTRPWPTLRADPDRLDQILGNLLSNAIKYSPAGGRVSIRCGEDGEQSWIQIRDSGIGIPLDEQDFIFMPFYRPPGSSTEAGGAGLGLTIVRDLMKAHGGRVELESEPGRGSQFTIWFRAGT